MVSQVYEKLMALCWDSFPVDLIEMGAINSHECILAH